MTRVIAEASLCVMIAVTAAGAISDARAAPPGATKPAEASDTLSVQGSLTYVKGAALPADSVALIELREATPTEGQARPRAVAEVRQPLAGRQVPIPFSLEVKRGDVASDRAYVVRALVLVSGRPAWISAPGRVSLTGDRVDVGTLQLETPKQPPPRPLRCGTRGAIMRAGDVAELTVGPRRWLLTQVPSASGARYVSDATPATSLAIKGDRATLVVAGEPWDECAVGPFRAQGNEPPWELELSTDLRFMAGDMRLQASLPPLDAAPGAVRYTAMAQFTPLSVAVFERRCVDSMSGMPYPHTVQVSVSGKTYQGCGGEPASLLLGTEWVVSDVSNVSLGKSPVTLKFDTAGRARGQAPCGPYEVGYLLTGEGLTLSLGDTASRKCGTPLAEEERGYFGALQRTRRFEIQGDGSLVLRASDGRTIVARPRAAP